MVPGSWEKRSGSGVNTGGSQALSILKLIVFMPEFYAIVLN